MVPYDHINPPPPPPPLRRLQNAAIFTITSWKANLAAAGRVDCQQQLPPCSLCTDRLALVLYTWPNSRQYVSQRKRADIYKVTLDPFLLMEHLEQLCAQKSSVISVGTLFDEPIFLKDVGSFGIRLVPLSRPDVILAGWSGCGCDYFWREVTQGASASTKLSISDQSICSSPTNHISITHHRHMRHDKTAVCII